MCDMLANADPKQLSLPTRDLQAGLFETFLLHRGRIPMTLMLPCVFWYAITMRFSFVVSSKSFWTSFGCFPVKLLYSTVIHVLSGVNSSFRFMFFKK